MSVQGDNFDYDVALSFAEEDRAIACAIAKGLSSRNIRVFYDEFEESKLWGKNLYDHLADVYSKRAAFCLMIISRSYAQKAWTTHERRSAQARAFNEKREYILPLRLDDTQIPGIDSTVAYVDYRKSSIDKIVNLLESKLNVGRSRAADGKGLQGIESAVDAAILGLDLSEVGRKIVAEGRDGWECGLFLEVLRGEIESCQGLKLELEYGLVTNRARRFGAPEFFEWVSGQLELLIRQQDAFTRLAQEGLLVVLGPEEAAGNPVSICLIARKMGGLYRWAAEWGIEFRSVLVGGDFARLIDLYGKVSLALMEGVERLYGSLKSAFDHWCGLDEMAKAEYQPQVTVPLPSPYTEEIKKEMERLRKIYRW
jgi:hypothetical protein